MVELARATTRDLPGIEIVELTGDGLPFPDAAFDIAFTVTVLNHNHDAMLERVVGEAARVTRERLYLFEDTASRKDARTAACYSSHLRSITGTSTGLRWPSFSTRSQTQVLHRRTSSTTCAPLNASYSSQSVVPRPCAPAPGARSPRRESDHRR